MKKGCLFIVVIIPVIIGTFYYIFDKYGIEFWKNKKPFEVIEILDRVDDAIEKLPTGEYADSVRVYLSKYFENINTNDLKNVINNAEKIIDQIGENIKNNVGDSLNFMEIKKILKDNGN